MDEMEFDRTRKAINLQKLSEEERKKLLQSFKEGGGKVLNEKSVKKESKERKIQSDISSISPLMGEKQKKEGRRDLKLPAQIYREEKMKESEQVAKEKIIKEKEIKKASSFLSLLTLKISAWIDKIILFNSKYIHPDFLSFLNLEFKRAIMECNIVCTEVLGDKNRLDSFKKSFTNPFYLELLKRIYLLYDRSVISEFSRSEEKILIDTMKNPILFYLKKLYIISSFREQSLKILLSCINLEEKMFQKNSDIYKNKQKRIIESWKIIMDEAFPKFIKSIQLIENKKLEPYTRLFEEMIGVDLSEKLDPNLYKTFEDVNLSALNVSLSKTTQEQQKEANKNIEKENIQSQDEQIEKKEVDSEEEKKQQIQDKIFNYGLRFLQYYSLEELQKKFDPKDELKDISKYDKIFITYLYLNFFDLEFGFLLSTNKLKLNIVVKDGVRINYKEEMSRLYENFRRVYESFRKYYFDLKELKKFEEDEYVNKNSIVYNKKLDYYKEKKLKTSKETYKSMLEYIKQVESIMLLLYKDIKNMKKIVINPEETIKFETADMQMKLMNNKKIMDIIRDAYATIYTLSCMVDGGKLKIDSFLELTEEEYNLYFKY